MLPQGDSTGDKGKGVQLTTEIRADIRESLQTLRGDRKAFHTGLAQMMAGEAGPPAFLPDYQEASTASTTDPSRK